MEIRRHEFFLDLPPEPIYLEADPTRLMQVLTNLLNNAAKYTDDGGRVVLTVRREGDEAVLSVRDNGRGIDPALLPRMFDLFVQGDRSLARTEGGLGIGLTLTRRLVQMHGGTLSAHSEGPGRGSEFTVRLRALKDGGGRMRDEGGRFHGLHPSSLIPHPSGRRVLVVEDNRDAAATLLDLLELWGHEVRVVHHGPAALRIAPEFRPDVVLLDSALPVRDGFVVGRRLRAPDGAGTLFVAVTGYGQQDHRQRAAASGFDRHLTKPVNPEELRAVIEGGPALSRC
jgi:two-component system CheB/CheR fusion protein